MLCVHGHFPVWVNGGVTVTCTALAAVSLALTVALVAASLALTVALAVVAHCVCVDDSVGCGAGDGGSG